jgi:Regulator of ribonuclease activity B
VTNSSTTPPRNDKELADLADVSLEFWLAEKDFNRNVTEALQKHGDSLVIPRTVTHLFIGPRTVLEVLAAELGDCCKFKIVDPGTTESVQGVDLAQLFASEIIPCELDAITLRTIQLRWIARDFSVEYDGWEAGVVRS